jgi:hypothetical protein
MDALAVQGVTMREHCSQRWAAHAPGAAQRTSGAVPKRDAGVEGLDREKPCELNASGILVYLHNMISERFSDRQGSPYVQAERQAKLGSAPGEVDYLGWNGE